MLYYLHNLSDVFGPLRLFEYISFRAGGAFFTAFAITVLIIPFLLPFFKRNCVQKSSRTDDGKKPHKPLMGGVVIIGAIVIAALLWGKIPDRKLLVFIAATIAKNAFLQKRRTVFFTERSGRMLLTRLLTTKESNITWELSLTEL